MKERFFVTILKFYRNLSIKYKLLLVLYIQIIIPLTFIGYMSYHKSAEVVRNKSIMYSQDILKSVEMRLNDYFYNLTALSQDMLFNLYTQNNHTIYKALNDNITAQDSISYDALYYHRYNDIKNILQKIIYSRKEVESIYFITNNEEVYSSDSNRSTANVRDILPYEQIIDKAREAEGRPIWYVEYNGKTAENIYLSRIINNLEDYKEIGLMVFTVKKKFFETICEDMLTDAMQNIAIISENNEIIMNDQEDILYIIENNLLKKVYETKDFFIDDQTNMLISYVILNEPKWMVVIPTSLKLLYKEIDIIKKWIFLVSFITIIVFSILSIFIAIDFIKPINHLVRGMKNIQKGKLYTDIEVNRNDEFGFLSRTFNKMSAEMNYLINGIYKEQITRKEAELKALQAQINPHFLFNTLESINWMAQLNDVPEISDTVSSLSTLMELSIGRDDKLITIGEELNYIDHYISILKIRFEDKIQLIKDVSPDTFQNEIPRLLIQPLIENAIYHGIEKNRKKGIIYIHIFKKEQNIIIEVMDNGKGLEKNVLDELNGKLNMDSDMYFKDANINKSKSIGLENVNRRIKLFYGDAYGVKIESEVGKYTKIIVKIPL